MEEDLERWTRLYYVGAQAFESGIMQGELAAEAFLTDQSLDKTETGFSVCGVGGRSRSSGCNCPYGIFGQHNDRQWSGSRKAGICDRKLEPCTGADEMAQLMSQFGDSIELVIANNDDMALGAIDALKASDLTKDEWPAVIGIDGTDVGLEAVKIKR